jgi:hypothetical protein
LQLRDRTTVATSTTDGSVNASIDLAGLVADDIPDNAATLLGLLLDAHQRAARDNQNASTLAFVLALQGSASFHQAVAAAAMTMGERHAPIRQARTVFESATPEWIAQQIKTGARIPGFGNSFHRGRVDPAFDDVYRYLSLHFQQEFMRLATLTSAVWDSGRKVYPNAAMFTAMVCTIIGFPHGPEDMLFLMARMPVWASIGLLPTPKKELVEEHHNDPYSHPH